MNTGADDQVKRHPGRPEIGPVVVARVSTETLSLIDAYAGRYGVPRAEAVRRLLEVALEHRA